MRVVVAGSFALGACRDAERTWLSTNGEIAIFRVVAPAPVNVGAPSEATMAVYATFLNRGATADTLAAVESAAARTAGLHARTMEPTTRVPLPAGMVERLAPGGTHAMLEGLARQFAPGDSLSLTLVFRRAGRVPVIARVVSYEQLEQALRP